MFGHERFKAYQLSIEFVKIALQLLDQIPKGNRNLQDQFKRAAISIPLNLAEGSGKTTNKDKLKFYAIARGSVMECAAICDVIKLTENRFEAQATDAKKLLEQIARILSSICLKKTEAETRSKTRARTRTKD